MRKWRVEDSEELYNIKAWGVNYFGINDKGNVYVKPRRRGTEIDLKELVDELQTRDVALPVLIRFPDILDNRIEHMFKCFKNAASDYEFKGKYYNIFPIKVNQMRPVIEEIMRSGTRFNVGLEAGSKPELHVVLAEMNNPEALIICNGYKDEAFIELALLAKKMGKNIFIVAEKLNELKRIIEISERIKVKPNIGIRIKLASSGAGKWEESGGDQSKFGLNPSELLAAIDYAREKDLLDHVKMIHFHLGSQITKIRKIKTGLRECSQFYVQLRKMGCNIEFVDIGGGLGVDYDGSKSSGPSSINYTIQEYMNDAVYMFQDASDKNELPHPNLITESGRSLTAHHSVLITNVLEVSHLPYWKSPESFEDTESELLLELNEIYQNLSSSNMLESWHDAVEIREEALDKFSLSLLSLETRAHIEKLFWTIAREIYKKADDLKHSPEEFRKLGNMLSDKYFCNLSIFQSLPDSWAIDQVFPIMPVHRLLEQPDINATIQDITCDSDGKIDNFMGTLNTSKYLKLHNFNPEEAYFVGFFLVGAYQEILGDMHNLFGDTNVVHITLTEDGYEINQIIDGETVAEVLSYVQYNSKKLVRTMETWVTKSVKDGKITQKEGKEFLANYRSGLYGYTYLV